MERETERDKTPVKDVKSMKGCKLDFNSSRFLGGGTCTKIKDRSTVGKNTISQCQRKLQLESGQNQRKPSGDVRGRHLEHRFEREPVLGRESMRGMRVQGNCRRRKWRSNSGWRPNSGWPCPGVCAQVKRERRCEGKREERNVLSGSWDEQFAATPS